MSTPAEQEGSLEINKKKFRQKQWYFSKFPHRVERKLLFGGIIMKFTKMHGTGNDYIYLYQEPQEDFPKLSQRLSHRHKGIGGDGIIHLYPSDSTADDFVMEMYNADGSEGAMCGNGIRCAGKFLYEAGHTQKTTLAIATKSGTREILLHPDSENNIPEVTVSMGIATGFTAHKLSIDGQNLEGMFVSVGNPHFVILCPNPQHIPLDHWGPIIERHPLFGEDGVNVEFYSPTDHGFAMRVWERGSGETQSCGTGACACYAVGQDSATLSSGAVTANLLGGTLEIWQEPQGKSQNLLLRGEAVTVYQGEIHL